MAMVRAAALAEEQQRQREQAMRRVLLRLSHAERAAAWRAWERHVLSSRLAFGFGVERDAAQSALAEAMRRQAAAAARTVRGVVLRMQLRRQSKAWTTWVDGTHHAREAANARERARRSGRRVVRRLLQRKLAAAWQSWFQVREQRPPRLRVLSPVRSGLVC